MVKVEYAETFGAQDMMAGTTSPPGPHLIATGNLFPSNPGYELRMDVPIRTAQ